MPNLVKIGPVVYEELGVTDELTKTFSSIDFKRVSNDCVANYTHEKAAAAAQQGKRSTTVAQ